MVLIIRTDADAPSPDWVTNAGLELPFPANHSDFLKCCIDASVGRRNSMLA
jgi:hypothetical protein